MDSETEEMLKTVESCALCRCGCCKDECPMYSEILEETISPKGRNFMIRAVLKGIIEPDERTARIAYSCLLCRRDEQSCVAKLKSAEVNEHFRKYLVDRGVPLLPEHEVLVKSLENYGNPWQEPKSSRKRWAKDFPGRRAVPGKTDTLFYVGCTFSVDRSLQESPKSLAHLMERAGEEYGLLLEDELCCGSTVKRIGHAKLFEKLRRENEKRILGTGARRVVTACAGCFKTLKQDYPGLSEKVNIQHSTEYLGELVRSGKLKLPEGRITVTYHDPCHLGRHAEVYDAPRDILRAVPGLRLVEMENSREFSRCCGGGAGVKTAYPEISMSAAKRRVKEAEDTGASAIITTCPFCVQTLRAAAESSGSRLEVLELTVFLDHLTSPEGGLEP